MQTILRATRLLLALSLLTGVLYPLLIWLLGQVCFAHQASGSLVLQGNRIVGSRLLAQAPAGPRYFHPRPSAGNYATVASAASQLPWSSQRLRAEVALREASWVGLQPPPPEMLATSGSGLDPDISLASAQAQLGRVAAARGLEGARRAALEGILLRESHADWTGGRYVNVLEINLELDRLAP